MSSTAEPLQRDELHLFLAVLLHLAVGLIIYAFLVTGERKPHAVMLEGLPIIFGKMVSPGTNDGDAPKTLAKSDPVQAQGTAPETAAQAAIPPLQQQKPITSAEAKPSAQRTGTVAAAKPPVTPEVRSVQPMVTKSEARPPADVAMKSPAGQPAVAANVPALRLQPDPEEVERNPPPEEAAAGRVAETVSTEPPKSVPPIAEKATTEADAKLANVPGIKPAIVPQLDSRQRVIVPPKPVEREPEKAVESEVKIAEAKRAAEAANAVAEANTAAPADAATAETKTPSVQASRPVAAQAQTAQAQTAQAQTAQAQSSVAAPETEAAQAVADPDGKATGGAPVPRARAQEPEQQTASASAGDDQPQNPTPSGGSGAVAKAGTGSPGQKAADALRRASAALSGRLGGLGKGTNGVPGGTSLTGSQLSQGSRLAQACLEQKQVFKFGDRISTTFNVRIDRGQKRLYLSPGNEQSGGGKLSGPRLTEIGAALNTCDPFKKFVLEQPDLTTFSFKFASGIR